MKAASKLATRLLKAENAEAFLRNQGGRLGRDAMATLKSDVSRLVRTDMGAATRLADRIDEISTLMSDPLAELFAKASRARVLAHQGRHAEANETYEITARAMRDAGMREDAAVLQREQLYPLISLGRYEDALQRARAARRALARADPLELAQLEANVGLIYYRLDRYKSALKHYDKAAETISKVDDDATRALLDFSRSNVLLETDRAEDALRLLESSAAAFDRAGHARQAGEARSEIAYLQFRRGNYNVALASYYELRDKLAKFGNAELVAWCNQDIAEVLLALNAFEDASEAAGQARAEFTRLGLPYESAQATLIDGLAAMGLGNLETAEESLRRARDAFARAGNKVLTAHVDSYLAELALRRGDHGEALSSASASLRLFAAQKLTTKAGYARMLAARAAYGLGQSRKASRMAGKALESVERLLAPDIAYQCHHLIGRIQRDRGLRAKALHSFRRAVEAVEQLRGGIAADEFKSSFLRDKLAIYEDAIRACLEEGSDDLLEEAFRLVESSKSRALADLLARYVRGEAGAGPSHKTAESETRARLLKLIEELNWYGSRAGSDDEGGERRAPAVAARYRNKLARRERQVAQLFRRMEAEDGAFADIQRMRSVSVEDLRASLDDGETAIEFFIVEDRISAFIVTRRGFKLARDFASRGRVESLLASLRFQTEKFGYGQAYAGAHVEQLKEGVDKHLSALYDELFEPLELMIEQDKLIIIPHGPLHYVPFQALTDGQNYLVDAFEVSYAPSAAVLGLCRSRAQRKGTPASGAFTSDRPKAEMVALGVVDPDIPNIEAEMSMLGRIFPGMVKLTGGEATRQNLLRLGSDARFLHIASHGTFRPDNPMFSFLKLADSQLNFYSLLDLKLKAEMVTLSACQTGVNAVFPGDELHGLMRGFLYAGAPSLVVSLWRASDSSTAVLMGEMYRHIRAGATKRAALRVAQIRVKEDYPHPYYWAPFVLIGNPV